MCNNNTDLFGIVFSIIIGIAVAVLFSIGLIPLIIVFLGIVLVTSGLFLLILFLASFQLRQHDPKTSCVYEHFSGLILSATGCFVTAMITLVIPLIATSIISVVFIFIVAALFSYLMMKIVLFLLCVVNNETYLRIDN